MADSVNGCFFFFFSSRRRHTRCSRDWSSDVCSSDLFSVRQVVIGIAVSFALLFCANDAAAQASRVGATLEGIVRDTSGALDRKSTCLNSSHGYISYAVFCLKKKKTITASLCLVYVVY